MKKVLSLTLCAALLLSLLAGCAEPGQEPYVPTGDALAAEDADLYPVATEPEVEQELTLAYYPGQSLHPYECADYTNRTVLSLIYQSLFVVKDDYEVSPLLCINYATSDDMMIYKFYIDPDAKFSDGSPLTNEHVLRSFQAAKESKVYRGRFHNVWSMALGDDNSIVFYLSMPYENFLILLDIPIAKIEPEPEPESEPEGSDSTDSTDPTQDTVPPTEPEEPSILDGLPLGSGPYRLEETRVGLRLREVQNWWCAGQTKIAVNASSINLKEAESPSQIRDAFEFEDVGLVCADPGSDAYADFRCDYELWDIESGIFMYIGFNRDENYGSIFLNDSLCQALTYAIDRQGLVDEFYRGYAHAASLPASPNSPYYDESLAEQYAYNPTVFASAVVNAGCVGEDITMLVNSNDSLLLRVAKSIAAMMEDAGLDVTIREYPGNYAGGIATRSTDIYLAQTKMSANMDLCPFFYTYGSLSYGALDNEEAYAQCKLALENEANVYDLHKFVMDRGFVCPILFRSYAVYATRGLLTGLTPARDNIFYYDFGKDPDSILIGMDQKPGDVTQNS